MKSLKEINISYSSISTYLQCPYKWKEQYLKDRRFDNAPLRIGRSVHEVINKILLKENNIDDIDSLLRNMLVESRYEEISKTRVKDGLDALIEVFSEYKEAQSILNKESFDHMKKLLFIDSFIYETEYKVIFNHKNISYKGYIDLYFPFTGNEQIMQGRSCYIIDFKTSRNSRYVDWFQFEFYAFLIAFYYKHILNKEPPRTYFCKIYFLRYNRIKTHIINYNELNPIYAKIKGVVQEIFNDKVYLPQKNKFCKWCPFMNECPLYKLEGLF